MTPNAATASANATSNRKRVLEKKDAPRGKFDSIDPINIKLSISNVASDGKTGNYRKIVHTLYISLNYILNIYDNYYLLLEKLEKTLNNFYLFNSNFY